MHANKEHVKKNCHGNIFFLVNIPTITSNMKEKAKQKKLLSLEVNPKPRQFTVIKKRKQYKMRTKFYNSGN